MCKKEKIVALVEHYRQYIGNRSFISCRYLGSRIANGYPPLGLLLGRKWRKVGNFSRGIRGIDVFINFESTSCGCRDFGVSWVFTTHFVSGRKDGLCDRVRCAYGFRPEPKIRLNLCQEKHLLPLYLLSLRKRLNFSDHLEIRMAGSR